MKSTCKRNRVFSLFLGVVMTASLCVPAYAAGGSVHLYVGGSDKGMYTTENPVSLFTDGAETLTTVTVSAAGGEDRVLTASSLDKTETYTLSGGTQYQVTKSTNSNGYKEYAFRWLNSLNDNITVSVESAPASYTVYARYGALNQNNNNGGANTCTMDANATTTVDGGDQYSVTYTPNLNQEITYIKLTCDSNDGKSELIPVSKTSGTLAGVNYRISQSGSDVTVSFDVTRNMYVTALTEQSKTRHELTVTADAHSSANVTRESVVEGTSKSVTFTPASGYNIGAIEITDGSSTATISDKGTNVTVNGHSYSLSRKIDGSAVLSIPGMTADVSIRVASTTQTRYVQVSCDKNTSSTAEGINYVTSGDPFEVTFTPDSSTMVMSFSVTTPQGTFTADQDDAYIRINNEYVPIYTGFNGKVTIQLRNVTSNMTISCTARDTVHDINVRTDTGITADYRQDTVDDGEDATVTFTPNSGYSVQEIRVTYDGSTYKARPDRVSYIRVDGMRWEITSGLSGSYTLHMTDIKHDVTVWGKKTYSSGSGNGSGSYRISTSEDSHSDVSYTGSNPFDYDEATTITVDTDTNYIVDYVRFSMNGRTATLEPFDSTITLDGIEYNVYWTTNRHVEIYFDEWTGNLSVTARSERGTERDWNGNYTGSYRISKTEDTHSNVSYTGSNPFSWGESSTVRVYTDNKYIVDYVRFTMGGKSVDIKPFTTSMTLDGNTYYVNWTTNANFSVYFGTLTGNLTVNAHSVRGTEKNYNGSTINPGGTVGIHTAYMAGYGNGYFGPNDNLSRAQALAVLSRLYSNMSDYDLRSYGYNSYYNDTPAGAWYSPYVGYAKQVGALSVLPSDNTGNLYPNKPITRAEFVALMCKFANISVNGTTNASRYNDVSSSYWAVKYINYATTAGWINGYTNGNFGPNDSLTRAQICVMLNRATGRIANGSGAIYARSFKDVSPVFWAYNDIGEATTSHTVVSISNGIEVWGN